MAIFKCKICGGSMEITEGSSVAVCDSCGTKQTIPSLSDEKRANLYERANHFRRINEFDKAMGIYEQILSEDNTDAEAYWSIVLCRYGIEYVEDPATGKRKPTVNRTQMSSVLADSDYKYALQYADVYQQEIYQAEAIEIDRIQKEIFAIVRNEDPYDVFISYKEKTGGGSRTQSSVLAQDLYDRLTKEGFRVFFSRISLEDKIGQQYEPYIYSALNTSKVMLVIGMNKEEFNAPWVKNEWGRFLGMMKEHREKLLIPCFKDMDVYELPEELVVLQSQDMSKIGFEQDLIHGISKIVGKGASKKNSYSGKEDEAIEALIRRAYQFVEDEDYNSAKNYCNRILDKAPECGDAFLILYCVEMGYKSIDDISFDLRNLGDIDSRIKSSRNLERALKFSDKGLYQQVQELIHQAYENHRNDLVSRYNSAYESIDNASSVEDYEAVKNTFQNLTEYDYYGELRNELSSVISMLGDRINELKYNNATVILSSVQNGAQEADKVIKQLQYARGLFSELGAYSDSREKVLLCDQLIDQERKNSERLEQERREAERRKQEEEQRRQQEIREAEQRRQQEIREAEQRRIHQKKMRRAMIISAAIAVIIAVLVIGSMISTQQKRQSMYEEAVGFIEQENYTSAISTLNQLGNYKDSAELLEEARELKTEQDYTSAINLLSSGNYDDALTAFNTLGNYKDSEERYKEAESLKCSTVYAAAEEYFQTGNLYKAAITFYSLGEYEDARERCFDYWSQLTERNTISAGGIHSKGFTLGVKTNGTVITTGNNQYGQCDVGNWTNIIAVAAGMYHSVGLRSDGTVVAVGGNDDGQCNVNGWTDIVAISAYYHTVGLKADGTVVATGSNGNGECNVSGWKDIIAIAAGPKRTVGLKADGTVLAVGGNEFGSAEVSDWKQIVTICTDMSYTFGVRSDGTISGAGENYNNGWEDWTDIIDVAHGCLETVGLQSNGTTVATAKAFSGWTNILMIDGRSYHIVGLRSDGTVIADGNNESGQCDVDGWTDIMIPHQ